MYLQLKRKGGYFFFKIVCIQCEYLPKQTEKAFPKNISSQKNNTNVYFIILGDILTCIKKMFFI